MTQMIHFTDNEFTYSGQSPITSWESMMDGFSATVNMPTLKQEVGEYEEWIPVSFNKDDESFTTEVYYEYLVNPKMLTVKVSNSLREYGDDNPQFNFSYTGFVNGEDERALATPPSATTTATKTSNVGTYPITISGGVASNYEFEYEPGELTVTKAPLSAKVNDATKVYSSENPAFTISYYGLKNNETVPAWTTQPTFQTEATQNSGVGQYEVKAVNGVPVNYDLGDITAGTLSVTPAPLTIKANDAARQYYSDNPTFSYTCNGFVNGEDESVLTTKPVLSTSAEKTSNVGTYEIKASGAESQNYSISFVNGTLNITPRTLIASVGNYQRAYNEENPTFEVNYNGFVGNEDEKVLNAKPTASTTATKTSDVGTYPITVSGGDADNYTFTYTNGVLTVNKAEQEIEWNQEFTNVVVGDQVELKAIASSGLPIEYTISDSNIANLYDAGGKKYLDCIKEGSVVIRALQEGNNNYYAAVRKSKTITISSTNGVYSINQDATNSKDPIYDAMGRKVSVMVPGNLYFQKGKKFIAK